MKERTAMYDDQHDEHQNPIADAEAIGRLRRGDPARDLATHPDPAAVRNAIVTGPRDENLPHGRRVEARPRPGRRYMPILVGLAASAAVITVATSAEVGRPPQINADPFGAAGVGAAETLSAGSRAMSSVVGGTIEVVIEVTGKLPGLDEDRAAYIMAQGQRPEQAKLDALRSIFSIAGEFREESHQGSLAPKTWTAGTADGSGPSIVVTGDPMLSWWFSPGWADVAVCIDAKPDAAGALDDRSPTPGTDTTTIDGCAAVQAPVNVPDTASALAGYERMLEQLGVDPATVTTEVYATDWDVTVIGHHRIDGVRSPLTTSMTYGDQGEIVSAGGFLGTVEKLGTYPRVGTAAGIARLRDQYRQPLVARPAIEPVTEPAVTPDEGSLEESDGSTAGAAVSGPAVDTGDVATGDIDAGAVEQILITVVEEELVMLWGYEEDVFLVPGYAFVAAADDYGWAARHVVNAVADGYFATPNPAEPFPSGDFAAGAAISDADAGQLLGLSELDAVDVAETRGWTLRISARDGEQYPQTMDYRTDRVNVTVEDDTVTNVSVG